MLLGRDGERDVVGALLAAARESRSGALVVRGEAGIGKTALLEDTRDRGADMTVLVARGIESESDLAFAGLHALLRPALPLLEGLPAPQAAALGGALGLAERAGADRFLVSAACLTLLSELSERRPVLCLVDDAQWMDAPSTDAMLFVARRLDAEGIVILFGARDGDARSFEANGVASMTLGALDADPAAALIERSAPGEVAPAVRALLAEQAAGNALALVELPAGLSPAQLAGADPMPEDMPLTRDAERLFLGRVQALPEPARRMLAVVATEDAGALGPVLAAAGSLGIDPAALGDVEVAGLVTVRGGAILLRHPLVRSVALSGLSSGERRELHLALAEALDGDDEADRRTWHRAAAAPGPDEAVAADLEAIAARSRAGGGHGAAATTLERAADLSPGDGPRARRLVAAATAAWRAGDPAQALRLAGRARPLTADPGLVAELDHVAGDIEQRRGSLVVGAEILMRGAGAAAAADPRRAVEMLFDAASCGMQSGDYAVVIGAGDAAAGLPETGDEDGRFLADLLIGVGSLWLGTSTKEVPRVLDVLARAERVTSPRLLAGAAMGAGALGDEAREADLLRRAVATARKSGAVDQLTLALLSVAVAGVLSGRLAVAPEAAEGLDLAREARLTSVASLHLAILSWLAGVQGRAEECRSAAAEVMGATASTANALAHSIAEWGLALLDLGAGRPEEVVTRLGALSSEPVGVGHPLIVLTSSADLIEAAVRAGRADVAGAALAGLEGFAGDGAPAWGRALAARCRGLTSTGSDGVAELEEALRLHERAGRPFDGGRTALLMGERLRRDRRPSDARAPLRAALGTFEALGAAPWAERARAELRATGETVRRRDHGGGEELTPQERLIARLVGQGLTNKEVAAQLFLSPRTIDAHLRGVFSKVGISSRRDLRGLAL